MSLYTGSPSVVKNTTLLTHTAEAYMPKFREVVFQSSNVLKALGLKAFGKAAMTGNERFGNVTKTSGNGILFKDGYQLSFPLMTSAPSASYVDQMGNINPQYVDPGTGGAYSWCRMVLPVYIPEEHVQDNAGNAKLLDLLKTNMKLAQGAAVREITYGFLGHSSAASGSPADVYAAQTYFADYSNNQTVGGISCSSKSYWQNKYKATTNLGGGGELDRPLQLLRDMEYMKLSLNKLSGSTQNKLLVATTGAFQYYMRAAYADQIAQGNPSLRNGDMYDAGIDHAVYSGFPMIYDGYVTVPNGATASTECIYWDDLSELGVSFKRNQYFEVEGWEAPRAHDKQRYYQMNIWCRWTPYCFDRRIQGVQYNMPANADAA